MKHAICPLCEAMCGLNVEVEDGRVISIRGDADDPLSRGHLCPKGVALADLHHDPDRLRAPLVRRDGGWQPIGWTEAFDLAAREIRAVQERHGKDAVGTYLGNPNVHNLGAMLFIPDFLRAIGTRNRFSATSVDQLPHHLAAREMFGHPLMIPIPDLDRATALVMLGANPLASNGSLMTAPDVRKRLLGIDRVLLFDPRKTETARVAEHHFIRPETDVAFLAAVARLLDGVDERLASLTEGETALMDALAPWTVERAAAITGVPVPIFHEVAELLRSGGVIYGRMGCSTQSHGSLCQWLFNVINVLSGALDRPGGAMFTTPAVDVLHDPTGRPKTGSFGRYRSRVRQLPEFGGEFPVSALTEELTTPGEGQIRALVTVAGNPVLSTPSGHRLAEALSKLEFMVSLDPYLNETTRHASLILPPASPLERAHYDLVFHVLAVRNTARWADPVLEKPDGVLEDWEILAGLEQALGASPTLALRRQLGPAGMVDLGLQSGPYDLDLSKLRAHPHGKDLGPLVSRLPERLFTEGKRIRLAPARFLEALGAIELVPPAGLVLIGRRDLRSNNSWMHNSERLVRGRDRCTLLVNPRDAARLGLGDKARVSSAVGEIIAPVEVSDTVMPGVVSLPHGWGHHGGRQSIANEHAGVSVNDLTDPRRLDSVSGNAAFSGTPVEVSPL